MSTHATRNGSRRLPPQDTVRRPFERGPGWNASRPRVPRLDNRRAETLTVNTGSRHVLEKTGLTLVRTFHRDGLDAVEGSEHGVVEYALIRAD
jgi:hypothetical protein